MRDGADAWCRIGDESLSLLQIRTRKRRRGFGEGRVKDEQSARVLADCRWKSDNDSARATSRPLIVTSSEPSVRRGGRVD